ncbi:MAG: hypothetical protein ACT4PV_05960 [Planctomycetaceae bacterium]
MQRDQGIRLLGLKPGARTEEVLRAYRGQSEVLKRRILRARWPEEKEAYRDALRRLVSSRDVALGRPPGGAGGKERLGVSGSRLVARLEGLALSGLDGGGARSFLGLEPNAARGAILEAYDRGRRALLRRYSAAKTREEMLAARRARAKLRTVRNFALA